MSYGSSETATRAMEISAFIKPMLHGEGAAVQSAVLANLTALWLAGHIGPTPEATKEFRYGLLDGFCTLVRDLIDASEQELLDGLVDREHPQ